MKKNGKAICPLCKGTDKKEKIQGVDDRTYYFCNKCYLIYADSRHYATLDKEKKRYLFHENTLENAGYVNFLNTAIIPARHFIKTVYSGLDYGCGPVPVLSMLLEKAGIKCENYDPFFFPYIDSSKRYDFIFATECFEHFFFPNMELEKVLGLLKKEGYLIVMTEKWKTKKSFKTWAYTKDFTHVMFYHGRTFKWIAKKYDLKMVWDNKKNVTIFKIE